MNHIIVHFYNKFRKRKTYLHVRISQDKRERLHKCTELKPKQFLFNDINKLTICFMLVNCLEVKFISGERGYYMKIIQVHSNWKSVSYLN